MAVYTEVTAEELGCLLAAYDIGELIAIKGIAEGVENSNYFVETTAGQYILTLYEKRVSVEDLPFFLGLMEHLAATGINCPKPIRDRNGVVLKTVAERTAAIVTFLPGYSLRKPSPVHCQDLGAQLAALHLAGGNFPLQRTNALSVAGWKKIFSDTKGQGDTLQPDMNDSLAKELDYLEQYWPDDLPSGVIHADLFPNNVLFRGDKISGLIDFYFACNDAYAYDLAICLNAWCFETDHSFNVTKARAMIRGYSAVKPLSMNEIEMLPLLARGAAMRFLLTRLLDWFNTPDTAFVRRLDPLEYLRKLRFHQRIEAFSDYGL